jgi:hypothetical protein
MIQPPWTMDELRRVIPHLETRLEENQARCQAEEGFTPRPLPPMSTEECLDLFSRLLDRARAGPLAAADRFLFEQCLSAYQMAVRAETLGKSGRWFVFSEADFNQVVKRINTLQKEV